MQDFCGQFPVFRLQEVALNMDERTRFGKHCLNKKINQDEIKHQFLFLSIIFLALSISMLESKLPTGTSKTKQLKVAQNSLQHLDFDGLL